MDKSGQEFYQALRFLYSTPQGKLVFDELKETYVRTSCIGKSPELTYYLLSRKELILELFDLIESKEETLEELLTNEEE